MADILTVNGSPAVMLADHRGRKHAYLFRVERDGATTRYVFEKMGDVTDPTYTVTRTPGNWRCTCKAFVFSSAVFKRCKHTNAARDIGALLDATTTVPNRPAKEDTVHV